jgi:hypothetical protein
MTSPFLLLTRLNPDQTTSKIAVNRHHVTAFAPGGGELYPYTLIALTDVREDVRVKETFDEVLALLNQETP